MRLLVLIFLFLAGCVSLSTNLEEQEDLATGNIYYSLEFGVSYPAKKFMTPEEWQEYHQAPDSQKEALYKSYKEREEIEANWSNFINNCLLELTFDC